MKVCRNTVEFVQEYQWLEAAYMLSGQMRYATCDPCSASSLKVTLEDVGLFEGIRVAKERPKAHWETMSPGSL